MSEVIVSMIDQCLARERLERRLAEAAENSAAHDEHFMLAERYADKAGALAEDSDVLMSRAHFGIERQTA